MVPKGHQRKKYPSDLTDERLAWLVSQVQQGL